MTQLLMSCHCLTPPQLFLQKLEFVFWGDNQEPSGVNFQKLDPSRPARQSSSMLDEGHRIQHSLDIPPGAQASSYPSMRSQRFCAKLCSDSKNENGSIWRLSIQKICDSKFKFILGKSNSARSNPKILKQEKHPFFPKILVISKRIV